MSRPPGWMTDATEPTEAEVARVVGDDAVLRGAAAATEPTDAEVARLLAGMPSEAPAWQLPRWPVLLAVPVGMAVLALALQPSPPPPEGESPLPLAVAPLRVDWTATEEGSWSEVGTPRGTRIVQVDGLVRYVVGPRQLAEGFVVQARDVEVAVVGTVFDVGMEADSVWVEVLEGLVEVRYQGRSWMLGPDSTWATPSEPVALAPAPRVAPPPPEVPPGPDADVLALGALLERVDSGERSTELQVELASWAAAHDGALARSAAEAAVEVAVASMEPRQAIETLDAWFRSNPRGPRRLALLELRADLVRSRLKDCAGAVPFYRTLAVEATGQQQARAEAWWGLCAASLGQDGARSALAASLDHGVAPPLRDEVARALGQLDL